MRKLMLLGLFVSSAAFADLYTPYLELGVAYNLDQPTEVESVRFGHRVPLYGGNQTSYHIETGVAVPTEDSNTFKLGLYWSDLIPQSSSIESPHSPHKLEVFSDYVWEFDDKMFMSVGVGYKLIEQTTIKYQYEGKAYTIHTGDNPITDKITARFSIGRHFGKYSLSLIHHSQWLKGYPFNDNWEYQVTKLSVNYTF